MLDLTFSYTNTLSSGKVQNQMSSRFFRLLFGLIGRVLPRGFLGAVMTVALNTLPSYTAIFCSLRCKEILRDRFLQVAAALSAMLAVAVGH